MSGGRTFSVEVTEAEMLTPAIKRLRMAAVDGSALPPYSAGSHTVLTIDTGTVQENGGALIRNPYSLLGATLSGGAYEVAVLKSPQSRGGSAFIHDNVGTGFRLAVSAPVNLFAIHHPARRHVLVAGGIGITPITAMAEELSAANAPFEIHYAVRDEAQGAFAEALAARFGSKLRLYVSARQERIAVAHILKHQPLGTHLYVCGPERMIDGVLADARDAGWPDENLHAERFLAPAGGEPFAIRLARSGLRASVGEHQTLLEAIEAAGVDAPYLCRGGVCGQCETAILSADGTLLHNDHYLSAEERAGAKKIMTCVSRLKGRELVLDL